MTATLLTTADQKERLSLLYINALVVRAGFVTSAPDTDRDSIDLRIQAGGPQRPALDLQLKATAALAGPEDGFVRFRLAIKNYDDLRGQSQTPRLLVVFELPPDESRWMTVTKEELVLRRRAYWLSLRRESPARAGQQTKTVYIPERNVFDVEALRELMERSRTGGIR